ncbi:MAG: NUDIX hydrolase [Candidatus Binatia bacterium]|nr:NUDIX hydrolase [Candidatus Binatia bacterium]
MSDALVPPWLRFVQQVQSIAQMGLHYTDGEHDRERYRQLLELAAEMGAHGSGDSVEDVRGVFSREQGPSTPKVDVRATVFQDDGVLLVRERSDGRWSLPGGWIDVGESASEAAAREVREETGYEVRPTRLLAVWDKGKHEMRQDAFHIYKIIFDCTVESGEARTSFETSAVAFFPVTELPELSLHRVIEPQIFRLFELHRDPEAPPDFD